MEEAYTATGMWNKEKGDCNEPKNRKRVTDGACE